MATTDIFISGGRGKGVGVGRGQMGRGGGWDRAKS